MTRQDGNNLPGALRTFLAACVEAGTTDTNILAERLCVTPGTVYTYFNRLFAALGVRNRTDLILKAHRLGLADLPQGGNRASAGPEPGSPHDDETDTRG